MFFLDYVYFSFLSEISSTEANIDFFETTVDVITTNLNDNEVVTTNIVGDFLETTMDITSVNDQITETSEDYNVETIAVSFMSMSTGKCFYSMIFAFIADCGYRF